MTVQRAVRTAIIFLLFLVSFGAPAHNVYATGEFQADYDVQYAIAPTGKTIVTQHVTLTNKLPNFYPQEYSLLLDSDKISHVIAYDDGGVITPSISIKDGKTHIALAFNVKAIGLGKSLKFSLRYEHSGIASKAGNIWEIYVPGVVNDPDIGEYTVSLAVPPTFGPAAYLSPLPGKGRSWTKEQMIRGGIAGAYGASQNFDITLTYTLNNSGVVPHLQEIALPPSTAYQNVTVQELTPSPQTVTSDADGNWLAKYQLGPRQTLAVTAKVSVSVFLSPRKDYNQVAIREEDYTKTEEYWQTGDAQITNLARQFTTARSIYDYVSTALRYDFDKVNSAAPRLGAVGILKDPSRAVCMEFTDLFIAIARAAGIPARRVVGYAYTSNPKLRPLSLVSDVLHAWPEYYDRETNIWVPVDPTWANTTGGVDYFTKLDFNHIVFAINGMDSSLPYPAGYYRSPDKTGRDIRVEFSDTTRSGKAANITTSIEFPQQIGAGRRVEGAVVVKNSGGESAYNIAVTVVSEPDSISLTETIAELLPYGVVRIPIAGVFSQSVTSQPGQIRVRVNDTSLTHSFMIQPLYWLVGLGVSLLVLSGLVAFKLIQLIIWRTSKKQ
ncbi:MAG: transglutaminase-like domain-containing protein [Patescibacteria group bacterium]